ncbi:MAG TPA: Asp-tRNA(Asn)/Glu-tRNA(Gln) amidotransferase subunit GatC [Candidatus Babeliaceae bacterium]|nr:Asp-tRNA(Asn)/Glu-tRNA(Gln) amidotransferase subunit GatC [Candidatus Babeliaceae bacterium]
MALVTREDIIKLAGLSNISIDDHEVEQLTQQIESVLSYASCLKELATHTEIQPLSKNSNIFRKDTIIPTDPVPLLAQAPEREGDYFVVPVIIKGA